MDWATWVGDVVAAAAIAVSLYANRRSKLAEERADAAVAAQRGMDSSLRRLADDLAAQRAPRVEFTLERRGKDAFVLRNTGTQAATDVRVGPLNVFIAQGIPSGETLRPGEGQSMLIAGASGLPMPNHLEVTCSELSAPQHVAVPAR